MKDLYRFAIESFTAISLSDKMPQAHQLPHVIFGRAGIQLGNGMGLCTRNRDRIEIKIKQCQRTCIRVKQRALNLEGCPALLKSSLGFFLFFFLEMPILHPVLYLGIS